MTKENYNCMVMGDGRVVFHLIGMKDKRWQKLPINQETLARYEQGHLTPPNVHLLVRIKALHPIVPGEFDITAFCD